MRASIHVPSAPTPPFSSKKDEGLCLVKAQKSYFEIQLMIYFPERKWDTKPKWDTVVQVIHTFSKYRLNRNMSFLIWVLNY